MISLSVQVETHQGKNTEFVFESLEPANVVQDGISIALGGECPCPVTLTPPKGDVIKSVSYSIATPLKNFHEVIVPDTGRLYPNERQLVTFWGRNFQTRINNIRMPVFILTGQDRKPTFMFGVIGENYETDFIVKEPAMRRALLAWMKRFGLEIKRGVEGFPVPESVALANEDNSITEYIYFKENRELAYTTWIDALRDFSDSMARILGKTDTSNDRSMAPYWCSWTDWDSSQVTDKVIIDNVREGVKLGIYNYIIDDGWFGPGLDSDFDVKLNLGDWSEDRSKIPDLKKLISDMHDLGARALIWSAPHAVSPDCNNFEKRKKYLIQTEKGKIAKTHNGYHPLCFMCPEARDIMADIAAELITKYNADGAKYDLFNNIPGEVCVSEEHDHDTASLIEGLHKVLENIDKKTKKVNPDVITELKQNYATPWLYEYGTCIRAGDTPYNPEGNFLRTAYINAYTPFSCNDYQTITNNDSPAEGAAIIIKMMAVGIPTYSMDLGSLEEEHKKSLKFYHQWYMDNLDAFKQYRTPVEPSFDTWKVQGDKKDIIFLLNRAGNIAVESSKITEIVVGSFIKELEISFDTKNDASVEIRNPGKTSADSTLYAGISHLRVPVRTGDLVRVNSRNNAT
ncbi:MAG: hypothetical protein GF401_17210 [Chitinivibrionales bacterium]|nr:hypothetical protein [Chitinivibrionales bacterium]